MALVVKKWRADGVQPDSEGNFVTIECRQEGIIAFLLNLLGIAPTTTIKVGGERVEFMEGSLEGYNRRLIPLGGVCSTYYGYRRPLKSAASIAAFCIFVGISVGSSGRDMGMVGVIIAFLGIVGAIFYYS